MKATLALCAVLLGASVVRAQTGGSSTTISGDLTAVSVTGNSRLSTIGIGDQLDHRWGRFELAQIARYVDGEANNQDDVDDLLLSAALNYAFTDRSRAFMTVEDTRNSFAGFRARFNQVLGLEWKEIQTATDTLFVDAGADYTEEVDDSRARSRYAAGHFAARYKRMLKGTAYIQEAFEFLPVVRENAGTRVNSTFAAVAPLIDHVALKLNYLVQYDSRPPLGFGTTDRILSMGIQLSY